MLQTETNHLILLAIPAWGHVRPLLVLAIKLLLERNDLILTVLLPPTMIDRALSDVATHFQDASLTHATHLREQIRVVSIFDTQEHDIFKHMAEFVVAYSAAYQNLLQERPITCAKTGNVFDAVPAPTAIIMDFFCLSQLRATREITGNSIPIIAWLSSTAAATIRVCGPEEMGGLGDLDARIEAEVQKTGEPADEVSEKARIALRLDSRNIVNIPGLPPMYDHEIFPQDLHINIPVSPYIRSAHLFFKESDGLIITTSDTYENIESVEAFRLWLTSLDKPMYGLGPLLPIGYGTSSISSRGDSAVEVFLEKSLQKYGEKSVLYISFGTIFWTTKTEYIEELVYALIEKELPFIFCHASPHANISDELQKKVEVSSLGLLTKWAPQQYVLTYKSIGWFLTHGGHGGITEALAMGIPLIGWPFASDQLLAITQLVEHQKVAIELIEVRSGTRGLKPIHRLGDRAPIGTREAVAQEFREVIDDIRGPKGKELAQNAVRIKKEIALAWEEDGVGKRELRAFLAKFTNRTA